MMARSKASDNTQPRKGGQLNFLTKSSDKRKTKMVSVRIDEDLLNQFQNAASTAEAAGYALVMTDVVTNAIQMAVSEVASLAIKDPELPLVQTSKAA